MIQFQVQVQPNNNNMFCRRRFLLIFFCLPLNLVVAVSGENHCDSIEIGKVFAGMILNTSPIGGILEPLLDFFPEDCAFDRLKGEYSLQ